MPCSANAQQGKKNGLERCRYDSGFWGKHVKLILRGFSHPDYTVGFGIAPNQPVFETGSQTNTLTKAQRLTLGGCIKAVSLHVRAFRPIEEAIITRGGVSVKEVDARTMASKRCEGLYFAGEILDLDGYTGGFNLQIAFSTAYSAGIAMADNF